MRRAYLLIVVVVFTAVSLWIASHPFIGVFDSIINWGAIQLFLKGEDPYDFEALGGVLFEKMKSVAAFQRTSVHPWTLTFILPFYVWSFPVAKFLVAFTTLSVYCLCIARLGRLWSPLPRFASLMMWGYIPFLVTMFFGQLSVFLLLGTVLLIEWLQSTERVWWKWVIAMALLGLKPQGFIVVAPFVVVEFVRSTSTRDNLRALGVIALLLTLSSPMMAYLPGWLTSHEFSYERRTGTLSSSLRDLATYFGSDSPAWLWVLPLGSIATLFALGVRITSATSFLLLVTLSQLTAPYLWVYDACALMPLFYALIGAAVVMKEPRWRRYAGIVFASVAIFPIYLTIHPDFSFMHMHIVSLAVAAGLLLPGLQRYLAKGRT